MTNEEWLELFSLVLTEIESREDEEQCARKIVDLFVVFLEEKSK